MKYTKKPILLLFSLLLAVIAQGCVYYYPAYQAEDGEYYNDEGEIVDVYIDEPRYDNGNDGVSIDFRYVDTAYYPWWSMDYYYLGPHYYRPAYWGTGWSFSFGINYGYGPYAWPWYADLYGPYYYPYAYYSYWPRWGWPRYGYHYNYWGDPYWRYRHNRYAYNRHYNHHHRDYGPGRDGGQRNDHANTYNNTLANPGRYSEDNRRRRQIEDVSGPPNTRQASYSDTANPRTSRESASTSVSVAPSSQSRSRSMRVRNRSERKISDSHIGPAPIQSPSRSASPSVTTVPQRSSNAATSAVAPRTEQYTTRYRSERKATRSEITPPVQRNSAPTTRVVTAPSVSSSQTSVPRTSPRFSAPRQVRQVAAPPARPSRSSAPSRSGTFNRAPSSGPGPSSQTSHGPSHNGGGQSGDNRGKGRRNRN